MRSVRVAVMCLALLVGVASAQESKTVQVGLQASGTFSWVIYAMQQFGIDQQFGLTLKPVTYASKQATELALRAGEVDVVVDDFVGAVSMRERGIPVRAIYPYSTATGGVVVRADGGIDTIADLKGKTIAASSLDDKSLLILRALTTTKYGFDPQDDGKVLQAAPPLMTGLLDKGEIDAAIPYWHFVARMTATGQYKDLMRVTEMLDQLGLRSDLPILVVVGRDGADPAALTAFLGALDATEERMKAAPMSGIWQQILDEGLYSLPDPSAFPSVRDRWEAGLPDAWTQEQIDGLVKLVDELVGVAGSDVVGIDKIDPAAFTTEYNP